jgi:hypothetical protein
MEKMTTSWEAFDLLSSPRFFSNVNSLATSPLDASLLYPIHGMSPPLDKCKGKEERGCVVYNIWTSSWPKGTTPLMFVKVYCVCWKFILFDL